ncbi:MAG: hypothetical protein HFF56_00950 [Lawsonibacter sp.]|nr:hypothetical protein [Lawsonibacter sp.]
MKTRLPALLTAAALLLTGCSALLERDYSSVTAHNAAPATEGDPSILRADSYQELVNALIYFVSGGMEEGTIRLYTDTENVELFLSDACLEVVQEDPLGAYCVEFIKYTVDPVVTYSEARVNITYRRTREQVASIVQATGTAAIRSELKSALASFAPERTLRISYFDGDESFIRDLVEQAYYDAPACALGMPEVELSIYPNSGRQRIVEIMLRYPLELSELEKRREDLSQHLDTLAWDLAGRTRLPLAAAQALLDLGEYDPQGGATAWDLFGSGAANSEGLALAYAALCQQLELPCHVAQGMREKEPRFWNVVQTQEGWRHLDLSAMGTDAPEGGPFFTDPEFRELGYLWEEGSFPACAEE